MPSTTSPNIDVSEQARRARAYWNIDGIALLAGAALYLGVVGAAWLMVRHIDALKQNWFFDSFIVSIGWLVLAASPLWIIALWFWFSRNWEDVIEWFKVRITYPRTGYTSPPAIADLRLLLTGYFFFIILRALALARLPKLWRFQGLLLWLCGVGCAFLLWRDFQAGVFVTLLVPGLLVVYVGGRRLYRYLHYNPLPSG